MKKLICILLCAIMVMSFGIVSNGEDGKTMTRIEAVRLMTGVLGIGEKEYECPFTDVEDADKNLIGYAFEKGWIKGTGNNLFCPDDAITRECFLTMVLRSLKYTDNISFVWDNPYERAQLAGIYPVVYEGEFTKAEAEDIIARKYYAYSMYSPRIPMIDGNNYTTEEWDMYTDSLSYVSSQTGKLEHLYDLPQCTVVIGYITGTPHGAVPKGSIVFKDSGEIKGIDFPRISPWKCMMPEQIWVSEDNTKLYYLCTVEQDYVGMDGVTVLQEAGQFKYTVDLATRETTVEKVEKI